MQFDLHPSWMILEGPAAVLRSRLNPAFNSRIRHDMDTAKSYDALARHYHLIFENWEASLERQAAVLSSILELKCGLPGTARVLDCACGIGTQSLGLAKLGFRVHSCDVSARAVERARLEAS